MREELSAAFTYFPAIWSDSASSASSQVDERLTRVGLLPCVADRDFNSRVLDEIRICSRCGREIIACRRTVGGQLLSEFVSIAGECWKCAVAR
jgi:hypothetical protein